MGYLRDAGQEVLGTCREAKENFTFDQLVKKYDQHTAEMLVAGQLQEAGLSVEEFRTYKKVKKVVQNGGLDVAQAHKDAKKAADDALGAM